MLIGRAGPGKQDAVRRREDRLQIGDDPRRGDIFRLRRNDIRQRRDIAARVKRADRKRIDGILRQVLHRVQHGEAGRKRLQHFGVQGRHLFGLRPIRLIQRGRTIPQFIRRRLVMQRIVRHNRPRQRHGIGGGGLHGQIGNRLRRNRIRRIGCCDIGTGRKIAFRIKRLDRDIQAFIRRELVNRQRFERTRLTRHNRLHHFPGRVPLFQLGLILGVANVILDDPRGRPAIPRRFPGKRYAGLRPADKRQVGNRLRAFFIRRDKIDHVRAFPQIPYAVERPNAKVIMSVRLKVFQRIIFRTARIFRRGHVRHFIRIIPLLQLFCRHGITQRVGGRPAAIAVIPGRRPDEFDRVVGLLADAQILDLRRRHGIARADRHHVRHGGDVFGFIGRLYRHIIHGMLLQSRQRKFLPRPSRLRQRLAGNHHCPIPFLHVICFRRIPDIIKGGRAPVFIIARRRPGDRHFAASDALDLQIGNCGRGQGIERGPIRNIR